MIQTQREANELDVVDEPGVQEQPPNLAASAFAERRDETALKDPEQRISERQPQPSQAQPSAPLAGPEPATGLVETEIGSLPGDLWRLIGETPPGAAQPAAASTDRKTGRDNLAIPAPELRLGHPAPPIRVALGVPSPATVVQRQAEPASDAPTGGSPGPGQLADGLQQPTIPEVDLQELARKVYQEIKHKLAIEWERRRF